jgi:TRAP-type transport system periplasmic protein
MLRISKINFFILLVFFTGSILCFAEKIVINLGSPFKKGHILCDAGEKFKEIVEKESKGRLEVVLQVGTKSEEEINEMCNKGQIDMQSNAPRPIEVYAPQYFFFNAPYVVKDFDHFMRIWEGSLGKKARELIEKNGGMIYAGVVYRGLRQMTAKKPIYTPEDLKDLKLRLPVVNTWIAVWKSLGVSPVPVPLPDLYKSLKEGTAESSEGDLPQIASFNLNEVQSHLIITNHLVQTGGIIINKNFFDKLSKNDKNLVLKAVKESCEWANNYIKTNETKILDDLKKKGMQVIIPNAEAIREKAKPAVEELFKKEWTVTSWKEVLAQ